MKIIITLIFLALVPTVYAQTENSVFLHCSSNEYLGITISNVPEAPPLSCDEVGNYAELTLKKARLISPLPFTSPYLIVSNDGPTYYNWTTGTVYWKMSKSTAYEDLTDLAHELGHVVFSEYLALEREEFANIFKAREKYHDAVRECLVTQTQLARPQSCELREAQTEIDALMSLGDRDFASYLFIEKAYNELFAAVFQLLVFEDTNLVINYLQEREMNEQTAKDNHYRLTPEVRVTIWNKWLRPMWNDKKTIVTSLTKIFLDDIAANYVTDVQLLPLELSAVESTRMIKALDR